MLSTGLRTRWSLILISRLSATNTFRFEILDQIHQRIHRHIAQLVGAS